MSTPRVEQMRSDSARKHPAWAAVREAFRVDWGPRTSVENLLEDAGWILDEQQSALRRWTAVRKAFRVDWGPRTSVEKLLEDEGRALDEQHGALRRREPRLDQALGFGNTVTEREILQMYASTAFKEKGLCVILVLKLAVAMLEYGQNTVDAELMLLKVIHSLGLPHPHLNLGARSLQMSFGGGPVHLMNCKMGLLVDKLLDISALCRHIAENKVDPADALCVLDGIIQRPLPFGWLVHLFNLECVSLWAVLAAFGTGQDIWQIMAAAAMITPFAWLTRRPRYSRDAAGLSCCWNCHTSRLEVHRGGAFVSRANSLV